MIHNNRSNKKTAEINIFYFYIWLRINAFIVIMFYQQGSLTSYVRFLHQTRYSTVKILSYVRQGCTLD